MQDLHSRGQELTSLCFRIIITTMAPKNGRKSQEGERLELSLRKLNREMRRLCGVEAVHPTKSKGVKVQIIKIGAGLARARAGAEEKRAALAQREIDLATSQEVQAKKDGERLTLQLGEHEAFALSAKGEAKKIKDQSDKVAKEVKDHLAKVALVTSRLPVTLESEDSTSLAGHQS